MTRTLNTIPDEAAPLMKPMTDWFDQGDIYDTTRAWTFDSVQLAGAVGPSPIDWKNSYNNVMDNLVGTDLPPFVLVAVGLAGPGNNDQFTGPYNCGDGPGTPRALELVTVSDAYTKFLSSRSPRIVRGASGSTPTKGTGERRMDAAPREFPNTKTNQTTS